jgi:hypothetical protein
LNVRSFLRLRVLLLLIAFPFRDPGDSLIIRTPLKGRISGLAPILNEYWVRAISVLAGFSAEARVDGQGYFEVPSVPNGDYFIILWKGLVEVRTLRFSKTVQNSTFSVDLR